MVKYNPPIAYHPDQLSSMTAKQLRKIASSWVLMVPRFAKRADVERILRASHSCLSGAMKRRAGSLETREDVIKEVIENLGVSKARATQMYDEVENDLRRQPVSRITPKMIGDEIGERWTNMP